MRIPRTVSFTNPNLYQDIEDYAKQRSIDFSQAIAELSEAGISLFRKTGSLNIENVSKIEELTTKVNYLDEEVKKLWGLIIGGKEGSPTSGEQGPRDDEKPRINKDLKKPIRADLGSPRWKRLKNQDK